MEGLVQDHETAFLELERTQGQQLQFRDIAVEGTRTSIHTREHKTSYNCAGTHTLSSSNFSISASVLLCRSCVSECANLVSSSLEAVMSDLCCLGSSSNDACISVPLSECLVNDCCCHSVATVVDVNEPRVVLSLVHEQEGVTDMDECSPTIPC